jgi:hypothetical protein
MTPFITIETSAISMQTPIEKTALVTYDHNRALACQILENYSLGLYQSALQIVWSRSPLKVVNDYSE